MDIEAIAIRYRHLAIKQQKRFIQNLLMLFRQEFFALSLRGPFKLVLDSNVLMRIEDLQKGVAAEGVLAVLCFFDYFKSQRHYRADLLIRPSVFYEYCRQQVLGSLSNHWERFTALRDSVEQELGIEVLFDGIADYSNATEMFELIQRDADKIRQELMSIEIRDWRYDFVREPGGVTGLLRNDGQIEVWPSSAAEHLHKGLSTEYFNSEYVNFFLRDHIAFALANNPRNNLRVAAKHERPDGYELRKVLYLNTKHDVRGLADVDLFSLCNTKGQFHAQAKGQYLPASIPLTVDENLHQGLQKFADYGVTSELIGGNEPLCEKRAKLESSFNDARRRMNRAKEQQQRCLAAQAEYMESIRLLFDSK